MKSRFNIYMLKKINVPLILGLTVVISLLVMAFFPKLFTNKDPYAREIMRIYYVEENGQRVQKYQPAPLTPNKDNPFGSDEFGRDILSRISFGAKLTLEAALLIALLRMIVALPLGLWAGLGGKSPSFLIKNFNVIFTAIPPLIACFLVLNIQYMLQLQLEQSIRAFVIVLTIVGWSKLASIIEQKTKEIRGEVFIEGEVAIGKSKTAIATQNVLPHLVPSLASYFFLEVGMALFLIAQLSVLYIFVGPRMIYEDDVRGVWYMAQEPEWASMLSRAVVNFNLGNWWIGLFPAAAFAYGIMGFNLLGEGMRIEFEKRNSKVISILRRIPYFFSPVIYYKQIRKFKEYSRAVVIKTICYMLIIAFIFMPAPKSRYPFEVNGVFEHINELTSEKYQGRVVGTNGGYMAADYIVDKLQQYGIEPFFEDGYFYSFDISQAAAQGSRGGSQRTPVIFRNVKHSILKVGNKTLEIGTDFLVNSIHPEIYQDVNTTDSGVDTFNITGKLVNYNDIVEQTPDPEKLAGSILYMPALNKEGNENNPNEAAAMAQMANINTILFETNQYELRGLVTAVYDRTSIMLTKTAAEDVIQNFDKEIEIQIEPSKEEYHSNGRIIAGVLRGSHNSTVTGSAYDKTKPEYVMIGASYDGVTSYNNKKYPMASGVAGAASSLELARILSELDETPRQDIVFVFYDGEQMMLGSRAYRFDPLINPNRAIVYGIDLGEIGGDNQSTLHYHTETPKIYGESSFDFITYFKGRLKDLNINNEHGKTATSRFYFNSRAFSFIMSLTSRNFQTFNTSEDTVDNLNKDMIIKTGQIVLDTLIWHCYGGE